MNEDIPQLTTGFCGQIASSTSLQDPVWASSPIVQILQARAVESNGRKVWRIVISDGTHIQQAIASAQPNALFENGHARKGSIVRLRRMAMSPINGRRQVIPQIHTISVARPLNGLLE